jgi:hypothetical protein
MGGCHDRKLASKNQRKSIIIGTTENRLKNQRKLAPQKIKDTALGFTTTARIIA